MKRFPRPTRGVTGYSSGLFFEAAACQPFTVLAVFAEEGERPSESFQYSSDLHEAVEAFALRLKPPDAGELEVGVASSGDPNSLQVATRICRILPLFNEVHVSHLEEPVNNGNRAVDYAEQTGVHGLVYVGSPEAVRGVLGNVPVNSRDFDNPIAWMTAALDLQAVREHADRLGR